MSGDANSTSAPTAPPGGRLTPPPNARAAAWRVFAGYAAFTLVFSVLFPWYVCAKYHVAWWPLDWYPMSNPGGDYVATYVAANALMSGLPIWDNHRHLGPRFTDPTAHGPRSRYGYPPLQVFILWPLGMLDYDASLRAWNVISLGLIAASLLLVARLYPGPPLLVVLAGLMVYAPASFLQFHLERGQTDSLLLFFLAAWAYFYFGHRNIWLAGFFLAAATLLKLVPGLLGLVLLLRRDWRGVAATAAGAAAIMLATGPQHWYYWLTEIIPHHTAIVYGSNIDHSLAYLIEGFVPDLSAALGWARVTWFVMLGTFLLVRWWHPQRDRLGLLDLGILSILFEFAPPYSVNYKLVALVFVFLAPFAVLKLEISRRRPLLAAAPLLAALVAMVPFFSEYVTRLPFSLAAAGLPGNVIPSNPLDPFLTDRKVAVALVFVLGYLLLLYALDARVARSAPHEAQAGARSLRRRLTMLLAATASVLIIVLGLVGYRAWLLRLAQDLRREATWLAQPVALSESMSLVGHRIRRTGPEHYTVDLVFRPRAPLPHNLQVFLHVHRRDETGAIVGGGGRNFFPSYITSYWPPGRDIAAQTTLWTPAGAYDVHCGLFELGSGRRYAEGAVGTVQFPSSDQP